MIDAYVVFPQLQLSLKRVVLIAAELLLPISNLVNLFTL